MRQILSASALTCHKHFFISITNGVSWLDLFIVFTLVFWWAILSCNLIYLTFHRISFDTDIVCLNLLICLKRFISVPTYKFVNILFHRYSVSDIEITLSGHYPPWWLLTKTASASTILWNLMASVFCEFFWMKNVFQESEHLKFFVEQILSCLLNLWS